MSATITRQRSFTNGDAIAAHHSHSHQLSPDSSRQLSSSPTKIGRKQHDVLESTSDLFNIRKNARKNGKLFIVNLVLAIAFYFEMFQFLTKYFFSLNISLFCYVDLLLALLFTWSMVMNLYLYCLPAWRHNSIVLSPHQKQLLGITSENEKYFRVQDPFSVADHVCTTPKHSYNSTTYPVRRTSRNKPEYSPGRQQHSPGHGKYSPTNNQYSPSQNKFSPNRGCTPTHGSRSFLGSQASYSPYAFNSSHLASNNVLSTSTPSPTGFMNTSKSQSPSLRSLHSPSRLNSQDEEQFDYEVLDKYIKKEEEFELKSRRGVRDSPQSQSIWSSYGRAAYEYIPNFGSYQLATRSKTPGGKDDDDTVDSPYKNDEVRLTTDASSYTDGIQPRMSGSSPPCHVSLPCGVFFQLCDNFILKGILQKLSLQRNDVDVWIENFRKWFAQTVLEPLVKEIDNINNKLIQMGSPELQIGAISQSSLQTLQSTKAQHLPSLEAVIPYLNVTTNQEYFVSRLKELETGGCLRLYRWDSGGCYKTKQWNPDLPTDAQIVIHLFCTYMDTHLPSNPRYADGKSFTGLHYLKTPAKPADTKSSLSIYQSRTQKPHFKLLVEGEVLDMPKGRNNLFCCLVVFLYYVKQNSHGMLERVNLGMSGINVLWILDKK